MQVVPNEVTIVTYGRTDYESSIFQGLLRAANCYRLQ